MANIPLVFGHSQKNTSPAPLACLECRRKHLKCNGVQPVCGRCHQNQVTCIYTPSRRGRNPRIPSTQDSSSTRSGSAAKQDMCRSSAPGISTNDFAPSQYPPVTSAVTTTVLEAPKPTTPTSASASDAEVLSPPEHLPLRGEDGYLLDFYYAFFHESHPILPPPHLLERLGPLPPSLEAVMKFIGTQYTPNIPPDPYRAAAIAAFAAVVEPTLYEVQALLLFSIALHARDERPDAVEFFSNAVDISLKLELNRKSYADLIGEGNPVKRESARRTWWELYIIDPLLVAFDQAPCKIDKTVIIDVPLPSEDIIYSSGMHVDDPITTAQFYERIFRDDEAQTQFSSYSYMIEAANILRRVLSLPQSINNDLIDLVESLDASIESWQRHIPKSKSHVLAHDGEVDQTLFRAYMIVNCASIYLHLPRSNLLSTATASATISCVVCDSHAAPASTRLIHATKAIKAANGLATLTALRSSVSKHTPFFICALVLGAVVQLCACSAVPAVSPVESRKDRLALMIGEMKVLSGTWAISCRVMQHVKAVAREVMEIGSGGPDISALIYDGAWLGNFHMV